MRLPTYTSTGTMDFQRVLRFVSKKKLHFGRNEGKEQQTMNVIKDRGRSSHRYRQTGV